VKTKIKKTYYLLILDKSGSMESCRKETINSFNEQLQTIKQLQKKFPGQKIRISLTLFNHEISHVIDRKPPEYIAQLTNKTYQLGGMTALYDAIGKSVRKLETAILEELKAGTASAMVVIITDGYENSSRKYSFKKVKKIITEHEASKQWNFSYLASTIDAREEAYNMNIKPGRAYFFKQNKVKDAFNYVNEGLYAQLEDNEKHEVDIEKLMDEVKQTYKN